MSRNHRVLLGARAAIGCGLIVTSLVAAGRASGAAEAVPLKSVDFRQDKRYERLVKHPCRQVSAAGIVRAIARIIGVKVIEPIREDPAKARETPLILEARTYDQKLLLAIDKAPIADVLMATGLSLNSGWYRYRNVYLLTQKPEQAAWMCSNFKDRLRNQDVYLDEVWKLSPAQLATLGSTYMLRLSELTPSQRQGLQGYARSMYGAGSLVDEGATRLRGVHLRYTPTQNSEMGPISPEVSIMLPKIDGEFWSWISMPLAAPPPNLRTTPPVFPAYPLPFTDSPEYEERELPAARADFEVDKRLSVVVPYRLGTVTTAVQKVVAQTGIDVAVSTGYDFWPVVSKAANPTAKQLLAQIELVTGGTWCKAGSIYALRPRRILERTKLLEPARRQEWLQAAALLVRDGFGVNQRERLANHGWLEPEKLNERQRYALKWLTALAFASRPGLSPAAVDLHGVMLENVPRDEKTRRPRQVRFMVPQADGVNREVARLPLE